MFRTGEKQPSGRSGAVSATPHRPSLEIDEQVWSDCFQDFREENPGFVFPSAPPSMASLEEGLRANFEEAMTRGLWADQWRPIYSNPITDSDMGVANPHLWWLFNKLKPNGHWDYKKETADRLQYKDFGNFHYGFVTYAFGVSPTLRDIMANLVNLWVAGQTDPPEASEQIEKGSMFASYMHGCLKQNSGIRTN